ncbi:MAG: hypothetical protein ACR2L6_03620 [Gemmatimonadaceae bacterium]
MSDDPQPALSDEEWIQYSGDLSITAEWAADGRPFGPNRRVTFEQKRHAVAAMALYNQSFGFTHDEEAMLEMQARFHEHRGFAGDAELAAKFRVLQRKISALLPSQEVEEVLGKMPE